MKKIIAEHSKSFELSFIYDFNNDTLNFCRELKIKYGSKKFNWSEKKWRFNDPSIVNDIISKYPDLEIDDEVITVSAKIKKDEEKKIADENKILELKKTKKSSLKIEGIKGELYDYQKIGVEFLTLANGRAILGDGCGVGKTVQGIGYIIHNNISKTLVVCPSNVKYSWSNELEKWSNLKFTILNSHQELTEELINEFDVFIINYDILNIFFDTKIKLEKTKTGRIKKKKIFSFKEFFDKKVFDLLILDEAHLCKGLTSDRSRQCRALSQICEKAILLTGTPIVNRTLEIFPLLQMIDKEEWKNYFEFTQRYCDGKYGDYGYEAKGSSNTEELKDRIKKYYLRRTKEDIEIQLPPKRYIDIPVELDKETRAKYNLAENNLKSYLTNIARKTKDETDRSMSAETLEKINVLRKIVTMGKIDATRDIINSLLDNEEKVIIFSVYNEPLEILFNEYKDCSVLLTGKSSEKERKESVEKFQSGKAKIFFGGLVSSGVGITLHTSPNLLFMDFSWVPTDMIQGQERAHRMGMTTEHLTIYQLYAINSMDERMKEILRGKMEVFDSLVEVGVNKEEKNISVVNELIESFK
jgi:SWI/SNF-related matrix-associated actin-dependent regulator 1 of chromatin subfamily A